MPDKAKWILQSISCFVNTVRGYQRKTIAWGKLWNTRRGTEFFLSINLNHENLARQVELQVGQETNYSKTARNVLALEKIESSI